MYDPPNSRWLTLRTERGLSLLEMITFLGRIGEMIGGIIRSARCSQPEQSRRGGSSWRVAVNRKYDCGSSFMWSIPAKGKKPSKDFRSREEELEHTVPATRIYTR